ncbi:HET-domain-containing protein [Xylaria curta]|nr:HET-domain-containing protein [Xylaria curta]
MWLLNVHTREMEEFISYKQTPPYAILSHTWGDEEVSFNDWQYKPCGYVERKEGFKEIDKCCRQAIAEGLDWVWVDTCCIDKSSSAELSEAINSMFRWYKNADVCYAYLYDVLDDIESSLSRCCWITRGWTLQELIAPGQVAFYSTDWKALGTRSTLSSHLATATGIDESFLAGRSLDEASIAQRMSWAAKRQTSRVEDEAYCLLGIFDVNMSLIYGEDSKAFRRLQEILVREYPEDHSLFAWGKIVKRLSNQVDDIEQIWGSKPINYDYNKAGIKYFGLLAESPKDFQHSGQVVCAPQARQYFRYGPKVPSVSALIGRTAHIELPMNNGVVAYICIHLKRLPTVQLQDLKCLMLLCGLWNDSHTDFHFITIPVISNATESSRLEEIVIGDVYIQRKITSAALRSMISRWSIAPMLSPHPQNGSIVMKRHLTEFDSYISLHSQIDYSYSSGLIKSPNSKQGILFCVNYETKCGLGLMITAVRLGALNHSHEDPTQARDCGRLSFGIHPFAISGHKSPELNITSYRSLSSEPATREKLNLMSFSTSSEAREYSCNEWHEIKYKHDMIQPRDEWRISTIGLADVFISVDRFFFDEHGSNDSSNDNAVHPFVDVLDIVVKANTEENMVEENGAQRQKFDGATSQKEATEDTIEEDNITRPERRKRNVIERVRKYIRIKDS